MMIRPPTPLVEHSAELEDPCEAIIRSHKLINIVAIAVAAAICRPEQWISIAESRRTDEDSFRQLLKLPHGTPSHDTFGRVFTLVSPRPSSAVSDRSVDAVAEVYAQALIAIDGRALTCSHDRNPGRPPFHIISAWATQNCLVLAQRTTAMGSSAIAVAAAVPRPSAVDNDPHKILGIAIRSHGLRIHRQNGAENVAMLRHFATSLLKKDETAKTATKPKRLKTGWHENDLANLSFPEAA